MENNFEIAREFYAVEENEHLYDSERDFTSLKAWQKAPKVKGLCHPVPKAFGIRIYS